MMTTAKQIARSRSRTHTRNSRWKLDAVGGESFGAAARASGGASLFPGMGASFSSIGNLQEVFIPRRATRANDSPKEIGTLALHSFGCYLGRKSFFVDLRRATEQNY